MFEARCALPLDALGPGYGEARLYMFRILAPAPIFATTANVRFEFEPRQQLSVPFPSNDEYEAFDGSEIVGPGALDGPAWPACQLSACLDRDLVM